MEDFVERCEIECAARGMVLTDDERLQIAEMESEGLTWSSAPTFIDNIRQLAAKRAAKGGA